MNSSKYNQLTEQDGIGVRSLCELLNCLWLIIIRQNIKET